MTDPDFTSSRPQLRLAEDHQAKVRCGAIGRNGRQCGGQVPPGEKYCHQHRDACGPHDDPTAAAATRLHTQHRKNAAQRGIRFEITKADVYHLFWRAGGSCEVTGIPFSFQTSKIKRPYFPSIDRIDSAGGYTPSNVRLVAACANLAMNVWGDEVLHAMAWNMLKSGRLRPPGS